MADQYDAGVGERSVSSLCQTQCHASLGQRCRKEKEQGRIIHWFDVLWCFSLPFCFDLTGQVKGSQTSFGFLERCLLADVLTSPAEHVMNDRTAAQTSAAGGLLEEGPLFGFTRRWDLPWTGRDFQHLLFSCCCRLWVWLEATFFTWAHVSHFLDLCDWSSFLTFF